VLREGQAILEDNVDKLHVMAEALMQYETIDSDQIDDIMEGKPPREPVTGTRARWRQRPGSAPARRMRDAGRAVDPIGGPAGEH
jgi:cell division protease FtsH